LNVPPFLNGGGEASQIIAEFDWTVTSLGPIECWPETLKASIALILRSPVPIVTLWGQDGIMIYNDAYSVFAGGRHPKLFGSKVREGWPEVADFNDNVMKVGLTGQTLAYRDQELTLLRNGSPEQVWMNLDYSPLLDERGQPAGVMAIVVETTSKIRAQRELSGEREALRRMFEQAPGFIAVVSGPDHRFTMANDAYLQLAGYREVLGRTVREALPEIGDQGFINLLDQVYKSGKPFVGRGERVYLRHTKDAEPEQHYLDFVYQPIVTDGQASGIFIQGHDVTEARMMESALQTLNATLEQRVIDEVFERSKAEEQLRQVQKMEAVGHLTGGIAHDFNNMLAVILGGLTVMKRKLAKGEVDIERFADGAIEGAQRAASLTQRLLAFSRQQPLAPETFSANGLVAGMSDLLGRTLGEPIKIETVLAGGLWQILADRVQLESAIINLSVNARDAMPQGGRLTIETSNAYVDDIFAREFAIPPGQYVLIEVADTGSGMTSDVVAKAFDPFYTTKEVGKGTGLGLSQVYGFVRQSGGHVKIYSEPGIGTTVKIYLPRYVGENVAEKIKSNPSMVRGTDREIVLVVEDEDRVRAVTVEALKELGYAVVEASNPMEALRLLEAGQEIHLLFTDVVMPGMSGRELGERARKRKPHLKILYTTGYTRNAIVHNGILDAGTNLLTKPFSIEELAAKVRAMLDS